MSTIFYPVAAFTSGLNVFKRDGRLWKTIRYVCRVLAENLGYIKVCAKFVPHTLKPHEKDTAFGV